MNGHDFMKTTWDVCLFQKYYCIVTIDMSLLDAFVIVSRPIKEIFYVNTEAITLISKFHPGVEIAIQPDTFDQDTKVILEVIVKEQFSNSIAFNF